MSTRLTPFEKETIILSSEGDDIFSFETFNPGYKRRLAAFSAKYPAHCTLDRVRPEGGIRYIIDRNCLSFHLNAPYTEERRQKSREQAINNGLVSRDSTQPV